MQRLMLKAWLGTLNSSFGLTQERERVADVLTAISSKLTAVTSASHQTWKVPPCCPLLFVAAYAFVRETNSSNNHAPTSVRTSLRQDRSSQDMNVLIQTSLP